MAHLHEIDWYTLMKLAGTFQMKSVSFSHWTERFKKSYEQRVEKEMLILSGAFPELVNFLETNSESHRLAQALIKVAKAGNEEVLQTWVKPLTFENGTYSLPRILEKLAKTRLIESELLFILQTEIKNDHLRLELAKSYLQFFKKMNYLAAKYGIQNEAVQAYRIQSVKIRNQKMTDLFRTPELQHQLNEVAQDYTVNGDASVVRRFIEQKVNASRRNFKDAAPFTVVTSQLLDEKTGQIHRQVYDAKTGRITQKIFVEVTPLEKALRQSLTGVTNPKCENLFIGL